MIRVRGLASFALLLIILSTTIFAQVSGRIEFLAHFIPPVGGTYASGCWGWTDTTSGREYALLGSRGGTSIIEITNTDSLVERDFVPGPSSSWRELQTYDHYAYVVSEGGGGTQIIDLSYLPDSVHLVKSFVYSDSNGNTQRSHTVQVSGHYLYLNGSAFYGVGGILIFDLVDPVNPVFLGSYQQQYIHDCSVRNDTIYAAAIHPGGGVDIIDATDKTHPQLLWQLTYPGSGTHNTATSTDGKYLLTTDEIGSAGYTLKIWDLANAPSFPQLGEYVGSPTAIVHNVFVKDTFAIMSYYTFGMRVISITDPEFPVEVGGYDSYPADDAQSYNGAWSIYPYFPSGKIILGDRSSALHVVRIQDTPTSVDPRPVMPNQFSLRQNYPNPFNPKTTLEFHVAAPSVVSIRIVDILGREVTTLLNEHRDAGIHRVLWDADRLPSGTYYAIFEAISANGTARVRQVRPLLLIK